MSSQQIGHELAMLARHEHRSWRVTKRRRERAKREDRLLVKRLKGRHDWASRKATTTR